jgi:hypothetical protein
MSNNDFNNAMAKVLAYGIARINNMDMTHEEALELAGVSHVDDTEELCKCGINEETWVANDGIPCVGDGCHIWCDCQNDTEETQAHYTHPDSNAFITWD